MIKQQIKNFRLGLGIFFLTFSGYYLPTYLQLQPVFAQATASQNPEADRLFQEAEQLVSNEAQFIQALAKYKQALRLYRQVGDNQKAIATRQRLETVLATFLPLAEKFEQEIDKDEAAFLAQFPKTEDNQTAQQLKELTAAQLGITLIDRSEDSFPISEDQKKAFENIRVPLRDYLISQEQSSSNFFRPVPVNFREYLDQNAEKLKAIRTLLLENESPRWGTDMSWISKGDPSYQLPSYIGFADLQNLFAIDILYKQEQGKTTEVQEALEAAWKLGQSLKNDPSLIGQVVNAITIRTQMGVMRKLDGLPTAWQQRLLEHDYRQSLLQSLAGELLYGKSVYQRSINSPETATEEENKYFADAYSNLGWSEWSEPMRQNFLRWEGIVVYQMNKQVNTVLAQENVCSFSFDSLRSIMEPTYGDLVGIHSWVHGRWTRAGRMMIDLELTQKILQMKEIGSSPQSISNIPSTICPNANWVYQSTDGTRSIALAPLPEWAAGVDRLPLIYTIDLNRN